MTAPQRDYDNHLKIKDALQVYFSRYHFVNGGYDLKWFKIKVGSIFIPLPNTKDRIAAVKIHDIHHVLTEYTATLKGEAEIGAWEIASGCGKYYVAWLLNFGSFFYGMFFFPKPLLKAFLHGRKCKTNFYYDVPYDENLLNSTVGELRNTLGIHEHQKNVLTDYLYFMLCCLILLSILIFFIWGIIHYGMKFF
jgi:hypothetical protein